MSFVDLFGQPPEEEPEPRAWTAPEWLGPPEGELPQCVALNEVVARSERAVVSLSHAQAYSTGIGLELAVQARDVGQRDSQRIFHEQHLAPGGEEVSPAFLLIGVELADGSRVSNLQGRRPFRDPEMRPDGPVLVQHGGGGGSAGGGVVSMRPGLWLWPVPPAGPLRLSCEWPLLGIALSTVELDAQVLRDACARAEPLWPSG